MKHLAKKIAALTAICCLTFFTACHEDDGHVHGEESGPGIDYGVHERTITLNDLNAFPGAKGKLEKIIEANTAAATNRNIYNGLYNFYVEADSIVMIENNGYHSLTFPIYRFGTEHPTVENLVLMEQDDKSYVAAIYKYQFTATEYEYMRAGMPIAITGDVSRTILPDFDAGSVVDGLTTIFFTEVVYVSCGHGIHGAWNVGQWGGCHSDVKPRMYTITRVAVVETLAEEAPMEWGEVSSGGGGWAHYNPNAIPPFDPAKDLGLVKGNITKPLLTQPSPEQNFYNSLTGPDKDLQDIMKFNPGLSEKIVQFLRNNSPDANITKVYDAGAVEIAKQILQVCADTGDVEIANEMLDILLSDPESSEANIVKATLEGYDEGYIGSSFNNNFYELIDPYIELDLTTDHITYFVLECALIKAQHPDWNMFEVALHASLELLHYGLDIAGLVPAVGEVADLANGVIYTVEGDGVNATLSFSAMIPVAGIGATLVKYGKKVITLADGTKTTLKWIKNTQNLYTFGERSQLRKVLGLAIGDARQAHHIIPWAKSSHPAIQKAAGSANAFHMNEALNGIPLSTARHNGSHANYDSKVLAKLDLIPSTATPEQTYTAVTTLINNIKTAIQNNPGVHINQLNF
ncbi:MAG: AHH domain-containing protein [Flavobacterium sp.]